MRIASEHSAPEAAASRRRSSRRQEQRREPARRARHVAHRLHDLVEKRRTDGEEHGRERSRDRIPTHGAEPIRHPDQQSAECRDDEINGPFRQRGKRREYKRQSRRVHRGNHPA